MKSKLNLSLQTVFATVAVVITAVMLGIGFYFVTNFYNKALQNESVKLFQQSKKMTQVIIDTKVKNLATSVESISFSDRFFDALENDESNFIELYLLQKMPKDAHFSAIIQKDMSYEASYLLYDAAMLVKQLKQIEVASLDTQMIAIDNEDETKLFFVASKGIVDSSGKVRGIYVAAVELNSEVSFLKDIERNTVLDYACIYYGDTSIIQSGTKRIDISSNQYDTLIVDDNSLRYRTFLDFNSLQSNLNICMMIYGEDFLEQNKEFKSILTILLLFFIVLILGSILVIQKMVAAPIEKLKEFAGKLISSSTHQKPPVLHIKEYNQLSRYLENLFLQVLQKEQKLIVSKRVVENLNKTLEERVQRQTKALKMQLDELKQKDKMLQEQAKLAAMGEMISAIAHQWRQPLNALSINIQNLEEDFEDGLIDVEFIEEFIAKQTKMIRFMSKTIDDFRNFFKSDKEKTVFAMKEVVQNVTHLVSAQLKNHNIDIIIVGDDFEVEGYKNEMQQVVLNIISNSKDAMIENGKSGDIVITLEAKAKIIKICDCGGGVDEEILPRIFEPYFTTKEQGKGTGIGLYMSRIIIIDHMNATMKAYNNDAGLCIEIGLE